VNERLLRDGCEAVALSADLDGALRARGDALTDFPIC
jgi:hypothetical protein